MKILKPPWIGNDDKPLYSVDIHPDGSRFATAGQGESSGRITIWNMSPVLIPDKERDSSIPKMLCQMDNHFACVNCVRWSRNGTWLASAGDDKLVMIWRYAGGVSKTFGSKQENAETWRCIHTLRGHAGDVLDVSWSPHDQYLASCSVDNAIVIWNAQKFPEQVRTLTGHTSMVKGVVWDPVGKYLASQSDDRTLVVWRALDWQREETISEPFAEAGGTTHVLRLDWSPDGSYLVSAHAMNNLGPTAQIISRSGWTTNMDFVGHRKAVTCVRFNPRLFNAKANKGSKLKSQNYCCCAIGSRDSSLSIWLTNLRRPLAVLHDVFDNSILDLSWSRDGTQLIACSSDSTVIFVQLSAEELGQALSAQEQDRVLGKIYGKSTVENGISRAPIIENAALLKIHTSSQLSNGLVSPPLNGVSNGITTASGRKLGDDIKQDETKDAQINTTPKSKPRSSGPNDSITQTPSKQIEVITKEGRRRITPIFLSPPPAVADLMPPLPVFSSTNQISRIVIEHASLQEKPASAPQTPSTADAQDSDSDQASSMAIINPMSTMEAQRRTPKKNEAEKEKPSSKINVKKKSSSKPEPETVHKISVKRKSAVPTTSDKSIPTKQARHTADSNEAPELPSSTSDMTGVTNTVAKSKPAHRSCNLVNPEPQRQIVIQISTTSKLVATNKLRSSSTAVNRLEKIDGEKVAWTSLYNTPISVIRTNSMLTCVAAQKRCLSVLSSHGLRVLPDMTLDSEISQLSLHESTCMVITTAGLLYIWDFGSCRCVVRGESLAALLSDPEASLLSSSLFNSTTPIVSLSTGSTYFYHINLQAWMLLCSSKDTISDLCDSSVMPTSSPVQGVVSTIQRTFSPQLLPSRLRQTHRTEPVLQEQCTASVINRRMVLCKALNSQAEYREWLLMYIRTLAQNGEEAQLRSICSQCTQLLFKSKSLRKSHTAPIDLMSLDAKELLKDILPIIAANLRLQRLFTEYNDIYTELVS